MTKSILQKLDEVEKHSVNFRAKNADILSGKHKDGPVKYDEAFEKLWAEVEKERAKMEANNGKAQSDEYTMIGDKK